MRIGRFEVLQEIGRGGAGIVYKARSDDGRIVAIKVLKAPTPERLARFEREARLLSSVAKREGFVPLEERGEVSNAPYIVMPFFPGGTLRERLEKGGALPVAEALEIMERLATALGTAHGRGIVHRDMKPENVLFDEAGLPVIADLGLAKHFSDDALGASRSVSLSQTGAFQGTAGYMAPEQMSGAADLGPPADVFSLGALLHECLTGVPPFWGDTLLDIVAKAQAGAAPDVRTLRPEVPAWLARVVTRALSPDPARRFEDGAALARALAAKKAGSGGSLAGVAVKALIGLTGLGLVAALVVVVIVPRLKGSETTVVKKPDPKKAPADEWADRAQTALENGDSSAALAAATRAVDLDAKHARGWILSAEARARRKEIERALADATRAIELAPESALAWVTRADIHNRRRREAPLAAADATKATELDPRFLRAWQARGYGNLYAKGSTGTALADFERALTLDPKSWRTISGRGLAKTTHRDMPGALDDTSRAIGLAPNEALAYANRAIVRNGARDHDGAAADLKRALELDPELVVAWDEQCAVHIVRGEIQAGLDAVNRSLAIDATNSFARARRASLIGLMGDPEGAIAEATVVINDDPGLADGWHARAVNRVHKNDLDGALADFDAAIAREPDNGEAYAGRAGVRGRRNDMAGLLEDAERAIQLAPKVGAGWVNRARYCLLTGDFAKAIDDATHAVELDPTQTPALMTRGEAYAATNQFALAEADLTRVIELQPRVGYAYQLRGEVRAKRGDMTGARADFEEALKLDPSLQRYVRPQIDALPPRR